MKSISIKAQLRTETGKKSSKKLRSEGLVPCVMYGGEKIVHFYTHENNFKELIYTPNVYVVNFDIDGTNFNAALKEIQFHPVTDKITHIDFIEVSESKPVIMSIPIKVKGDSVGVKAGGKLRIKRRAIRVKGFIKDLPDTLEVDITQLGIGQSIKINQLSYDNLEILDPGRAMVIAVASSRVALGDLPEDQEEEGEADAEQEGEAEGTPQAE